MTITDPKELRAALVAQLRGIPALVALVGGHAANVIEYVEKTRGDLTSTIRKMQIPQIMIYLEGITPSQFPSRMVVSFGIAVRTDEPTSMYSTMLSGVSETSGSDGLPLLVSTVHPAFDPMSIPALQRRSIAVDDNTVFDYWEISMSFADRKC